MVMAPSAIATQQEEIQFSNKINPVTGYNHGDNINPNGLNAKALVQRVLREHISRINTDECEAGEEDAFYVADLGEVYRQHLRWKMNLTRVKPFYGKFRLRHDLEAANNPSCQMQPG